VQIWVSPFPPFSRAKLGVPVSPVSPFPPFPSSFDQGLGLRQVYNALVSPFQGWVFN